MPTWTAYKTKCLHGVIVLLPSSHGIVPDAAYDVVISPWRTRRAGPVSRDEIRGWARK